MQTPGLDTLLDQLIGPVTGMPRPLRVMLTNDDGVGATGLAAVRTALDAAGHDTTVVAPADNQSGSSARVAFGGELPVVRLGDATFAVEGSPAEAAAFGLHVVMAGNLPDVVVSGANAGQNVGAIVINSGTVGAAVAALLDGVPAIALSTEIDLATAATPHDDAAEWLVALLDGLSCRREGRLLPDGIGLNVNYPFVAAGRPAPQARLTKTGRGFIDLQYTGAELPTTSGDRVVFRVGVTLDNPDEDGFADTVALAKDEVAVSVIEPNYDRGFMGPLDD